MQHPSAHTHGTNLTEQPERALLQPNAASGAAMPSGEGWQRSAAAAATAAAALRPSLQLGEGRAKLD